MRGSDPDAALYYLARMIYAGEDPKFIARRICICASEDVGNADPCAIQVAVSAFLAVERIGMPESQIILAQACTYVATAPKSNTAYRGIDLAMDYVAKHRTENRRENMGNWLILPFLLLLCFLTGNVLQYITKEEKENRYSKKSQNYNRENICCYRNNSGNDDFMHISYNGGVYSWTFQSSKGFICIVCKRIKRRRFFS